MTKQIKLILVVLIVFVFSLVSFVLYQKNKTQITEGALSESQARVIAESTCIKGGESLSPGYYNENSKTWWFDANLNATKEGCNPACVVSEESKTAEINWRCTGLIDPNISPE